MKIELITPDRYPKKLLDEWKEHNIPIHKLYQQGNDFYIEMQRDVLPGADVYSFGDIYYKKGDLKYLPEDCPLYNELKNCFFNDDTRKVLFEKQIYK